jgi:HD-GYP domain-containing protein (c-di-GMP phosphodiesterase class II)
VEPDLTDALVGLIEYKDAATATHTWRVVFYAMAVAEALKLDTETTRRFGRAAALHDMGKIDVPGEILRKPGKLTEEEFAVVRTHPELGHQRLVTLGETDQLVIDLVRHHHERWDGKGYPDQIAGENIPSLVRYFSIIDTFDALTSIRAYRADTSPGSADRAIAIIKADSGTAFDPEAVNVFVRLQEAGTIDWIRGYSNDQRAFSLAAARDEAGMRKNE